MYKKQKLMFYPATNPNRRGVLLPGGGYEKINYKKEGEEPAYWLNAHGFDAEICATGRVETLGVWGFGAGGHLAAMLATRCMRLNFAILAYPVIRMKKRIAIKRVRWDLLGSGDFDNDAAMDYFSVNKSIHVDTPPTFLFHTSNGKSVPVRNSLDYASAMAKYNRPFHI
ncbi:alpha/beta-hydrolase [Annulohypoxylon truncatum]|uniref:alpha/beta-hydrolase n=1 Tax=Annulohypoxylon truncatum TaxID=327061 RepID=UPI002008B560|nr:alpha/beta-hydrolase [Annulohypoxylon truncatum]KAI1212871.1 alpha/beta-hydrolase [Annulohypoxylon truncatum]